MLDSRDQYVPGTSRFCFGDSPSAKRELAMATEAMFQKKDEDDDKEIVEILAHAIGKSLIEKKDEFFDALHRAILVC